MCVCVCVCALALLCVLRALCIGAMSNKAKIGRGLYDTAAYEVFGDVRQLTDPVTQKTIPLETVCKFKEVQHVSWTLTMEMDDTVLYKNMHVKVIEHIRIQLSSEGNAVNSRNQFQTFIKNYQVPNIHTCTLTHTHACMHARIIY